MHAYFGTPKIKSDVEYINSNLHVRRLFENVTQRVLTEQHLSRLLIEQEAILNSHIVGIAKIRDRQFIWSNNAFETLLGYTDSELIGKSTRVCYRSDEDFIEFGRVSSAVLNQNIVFSAEHQLVTKDGSLRWFSFQAELLEPDRIDCLIRRIQPRSA
jgi:PAS domain S-box-containing protein